MSSDKRAGPSQGAIRAAARAASQARSRLAEDLERLRADAGMSFFALAEASGVPHGYLSRILAGKTKPSLETYAKLAGPLGADLSARLYANTGPAIRDRHQARILEALLGVLHPRWRRFSEVSVWKPVRGAIDLVLHDPAAELVVANEIESDLRRIEQSIRWSSEKVEALPSWSGWPALASAGGRPPTVSQLLVARRTRANRRITEDFRRQLLLAYPAHPADALAALTGAAAWPGSALVWAQIERERVRFMSTR